MVRSLATTRAPLFNAEGQQIAGTNDIYLDEDGNLALFGSTLNNTDQLNAVLQCCQTAAQAQLGEMVLATESGMPNEQTIWRGSPIDSLPLWEAALRDTLKNVPGVIDITDLSTTITNTPNSYANSSFTLTYQVLIITAYGEGDINGSL